MKPEIKEKWLIALRSGEYMHTKGALKKLVNLDGSIGHCCLGVLCEIYVKETGKGKWSIIPNHSGSYDFLPEAGFRISTFLPGEVVEWAGLPSPKGYDNEDTILSGTNDAVEDYQAPISIIENYL